MQRERDAVSGDDWAPAHRRHGFLQPQADERGQSVVEHQEHDGIDKVMPWQLGIDLEHPGVGAVNLHHWGDAKQTEEEKTGNKQTIENCMSDRRCQKGE